MRYAMGPGDVQALRQEEWAAQEINRLKARLEECQTVTGRYADACESEHRLRLVAEADRDVLVSWVAELEGVLNWIASHPLATDPLELAAQQMQERARKILLEASRDDAGD